jgi:hypothetical protein
MLSIWESYGNNFGKVSKKYLDNEKTGLYNDVKHEKHRK